MRAICAAACLLSVGAPAAPSAAEDQARFATYTANGWTITDEGEERCEAGFAVGRAAVLSVIGPYYSSQGKAASGSIIHLASETHYTLPKGDKYGEFPVQLVAGTDRFAVSGFATDMGGALVVNSGNLATVIDLLAALPDSGMLSAMVGGKQIYAVELDGNRAAARALKDCTAFITAQKRPGTKNGPGLGSPNMMPPIATGGIAMPPAPAERPSDVQIPILVLPDAAPPRSLPR